jgi:hypothetical protein
LCFQQAAEGRRRYVSNQLLHTKMLDIVPRMEFNSFGKL